MTCPGWIRSVLATVLLGGGQLGSQVILERDLESLPPVPGRWVARTQAPLEELLRDEATRFLFASGQIVLQAGGKSALKLWSPKGELVLEQESGALPKSISELAKSHGMQTREDLLQELRKQEQDAGMLYLEQLEDLSRYLSVSLVQAPEPPWTELQVQGRTPEELNETFEKSQAERTQAPPAKARKAPDLERAIGKGVDAFEGLLRAGNWTHHPDLEPIAHFLDAVSRCDTEHAFALEGLAKRAVQDLESAIAADPESLRHWRALLRIAEQVPGYDLTGLVRRIEPLPGRLWPDPGLCPLFSDYFRRLRAPEQCLRLAEEALGQRVVLAGDRGLLRYFAQWQSLRVLALCQLKRLREAKDELQRISSSGQAIANVPLLFLKDALEFDTTLGDPEFRTALAKADPQPASANELRDAPKAIHQFPVAVVLSMKHLTAPPTWKVPAPIFILDPAASKESKPSGALPEDARWGLCVDGELVHSSPEPPTEAAVIKQIQKAQAKSVQRLEQFVSRHPDRADARRGLCGALARRPHDPELEQQLLKHLAEISFVPKLRNDWPTASATWKARAKSILPLLETRIEAFPFEESHWEAWTFWSTQLPPAGRIQADALLLRIPVLRVRPELAFRLPFAILAAAIKAAETRGDTERLQQLCMAELNGHGLPADDKDVDRGAGLLRTGSRSRAVQEILDPLIRSYQSQGQHDRAKALRALFLGQTGS